MAREGRPGDTRAVGAAAKTSDLTGETQREEEITRRGDIAAGSRCHSKKPATETKAVRV